jgi:hypothetical protein
LGRAARHGSRTARPAASVLIAGRKIILVQDTSPRSASLNTHKPASLYEAFPAPKQCGSSSASRGTTPKHGGSWLDVAESELGVLSSQRLDRRIRTNKFTLTKPPRGSIINLATSDARIKLKHLYR